MIPLRGAVELLRDPDWRREGELRALVAVFLAGAFAFLMVMARFFPDDGWKAVMGATLFGALVASGPKVTFPLYFATWIGSSLEVPGAPVPLNRVMAVAFVLSWAGSLLWSRLVLPKGAALPLLALFTLYATAGGILMRPEGTAAAFQPVFYILVTVGVASTYRRREDFARLLGILTAISVAMASVGLLEFLTRRDWFPQFSDYTFRDDNLRINGMAKNAIQYAYMAVWVVPWAMVGMLESKTARGRLAFGLALVFLLNMSLLTYNRQTPIIVAAMLGVGVVLLRSRYKMAMVVALALAAAVVAPLVIGRVATRFSEIPRDGRPDISFAIRKDKVIAASAAIPDNPVFGVGFNNFKDVWWNYRQPGEMYIILYEKGFQHYVDLGYLQILVETGAAGMVLFVLTIGATFLSWRKWRAVAQKIPDSFHANTYAAVAMGFTQLGLSMVLQDTFFIPRTYALFGLFFAAALITRRAAIEHGHGAGGSSPRPA